VTDARPTPLADYHDRNGARMAAFAGWLLPLHYAAGVKAEHEHTRDAVSLFDVSHMGQIVLRPESGDPAEAARALETLVPGDILGLADGAMRYTQFTTDAGGILDDLMVTRRAGDLLLVVNASRAEAGIAHLRARLPAGVAVEPLADMALLALQGPQAAEALAPLIHDSHRLSFMEARVFDWAGDPLWISRSGYTGEDGFEISLAADIAEELAEAFMEDERVRPAGLGARDSLRLEAGLCLYGQDIDETTSPVEAGLAWSIGRARRTGGARAGGFPGAERILRDLAEGPARRRVGLRPRGRAPMRAGVPLFAAAEGGAPTGHVTSGGFGPTVGGPVAMGYVAAGHAAPGTLLYGELRGRREPVEVVDLPFVPQGYVR
jgi:aminomethyltransferase